MTPLVLGLALTLAAPAPKKSDEPPPAKLEGDWVVESFEGTPKEANPPGTITMHFADGKIKITESTGKGSGEEVDYTADLAKKPATIDIKPKAGGPGGGPDKLVQGILEIKGDELKICFGRDTTARPTEFKPDPEKGVMVIHLKRVKPEKCQ
jgi:uncharacterized protein (TIGR03067 family)